MQRSEWSGWVQAIGSILAILAGVVVVWWQLHHQRIEQKKQRNAEEIRRLHIIWSQVHRARIVLAYLKKTAPNPATAPDIGMPMRHAVASLKSFDLLQAPDPKVANAIVLAIQAFDDLENIGLPAGKGGDLERFRTFVLHTLENFEGIERSLRRSLVERGADICPTEGGAQIDGEKYPPIPAQH